ncbi:MAG: hypothetical protein FWB72_07125 [Firmicutes bacterium]|nr:hypothetical protein [Bacillota bacterium]
MTAITVAIAKDTNWLEIAKQVEPKGKEVVLMSKADYENLMAYQPDKPAMTKEEALEILMAEIQKGRDSGPGRPFEEFVKEYNY